MYEIYERDTRAHADDLEIVDGALAMARVLRDRLCGSRSTNWGRTIFVDGVAKTIRDAAGRINDVEVQKEVYRFGLYLASTEIDAIDDLISDHLEACQATLEQRLS